MTSIRLLPIFLLTSLFLQAQQLSLFTQYRENATIINPAAVETDFLAYGQNLTFGASHRSQWVGLDNAPTTQTIRGSFINKDWSGATLMAGGHLINDRTGPTGFTGLYGRIAAVISGDPEYSGLSVGLTAGAVQYRVDASKINLRDPGDVVGTQNQTQIFPDVGVGIYFYNMISGGGLDGDFFYAGVSIPQVVGLDLTFQSEDGEFFTKRVQHFYGTLGLIKFFDNDGFIEPSLWVKYAPNVPVNVDLNLRYQLPGSFWIGTGVSTAANVHLETGFALGNGFDNTIKIGYGFDYSFSSFGPSAGSTHELNLTFSFDK